MKDLSAVSGKYLYFEVARLRTLYESKPELKEAIEKRYVEIVTELNKRGAPWFWSHHRLDDLISVQKAFMKPNKPAWRIFTSEEVFDVSGFELPALVDIKIDGMRMQVQNQNGAQIYSEDEGLNKSSKFKEAIGEIEGLPEGTVLDTEGVLVEGEEVLHRTSFIGYVNGKVFDEVKDKQAQFWIFDVLKWKGEDLTNKPLSERLAYLKQVKEGKHLKPFRTGKESFVCGTREEVLSAIKKVAGQKGSEGAMIKVLSSTYVSDTHNKGWVKLKNLKEVDCLVVEIEQPKHQKGPLEGKPVTGVYNYHVAAGPYSAEDGKVLLDKASSKVREFEGKVYAHLGKTFNTEIKVKVGDIIRVWSPEINKYEVKDTGLYTYGIYEPKVLEWVHERNIPDSLNVLDRLTQETSGQHPREVEKQDWCLDQGGSWITIDGKHVCVGGTRDSSRRGWKVASLIHGPGKITEIHYHEGVKSEVVDKTKFALQYYPQSVKERFGRIYLEDSEFDHNVVGVNNTTGDRSDIRIKAIGESDTVITQTLHHEIGHTVWSRTLSPELREEWAWIEETSPSIYGSTDYKEDFCETLALYKTNPEELKSTSPEHYKLITKDLESLSP